MTIELPQLLPLTDIKVISEEAPYPVVNSWSQVVCCINFCLIPTVLASPAVTIRSSIQSTSTTTLCPTSPETLVAKADRLRGDALPGHRLLGHELVVESIFGARIPSPTTCAGGWLILLPLFLPLNEGHGPSWRVSSSSSSTRSASLARKSSM